MQNILWQVGRNASYASDKEEEQKKQGNKRSNANKQANGVVRYAFEPGGIFFAVLRCIAPCVFFAVSSANATPILTFLEDRARGEGSFMTVI